LAAPFSLGDQMSNRRKNTLAKQVAPATKAEVAVPPAECPPLTAREQIAVDAHLADRANNGVPSFRVTRDTEGTERIVTCHPNEAVGRLLIMNALGTQSEPFFNGLVVQLAAVACRTQLDETKLNFAVASLKGIAPRDETEAMLGAQMVAIHNATIKAAIKLAQADSTAERDSAANALTKLARTYTAQVEALKRYRSAGEQVIKVQHVTVNEGGQAIVGNVGTRGGAHVGSQEQLHQEQPHADGAVLRGEHPERRALPNLANAQRTVPHARRPVSRRA
jgi:hypothetical protein